MTGFGEICGLVALLGQRILGLAPGYEDVNDHDELRRDRVCPRPWGVWSVRVRTASRWPAKAR